MKRPTLHVGLRRGRPGIGLVLAGLVLLGGSTLVLLGVTAGTNRAGGTRQVVGRVGRITVTATSLHPGPSGSLTGALRVTTSGPSSDQLDAALAGGDRAASVYHRQVSVGEIPDLASCDGVVPSRGVINEWLHYGPLLVPGRTYAHAAPASATLNVPGARGSIGRSVPVTLYFAHAGQLTLDLPVRLS